MSNMSLGCPQLYQTFSNLRRQCSQISSRDYASYIQDAERNITSNPCQVWDFISEKRDASSIPSIMKYNGQSSANPKIVANFFAKNFSENYSRTSVSKKNIEYNTEINISHIQINARDVSKLLNKLTPRTCKGPDEISPVLLKSCASVLAHG